MGCRLPGAVYCRVAVYCLKTDVEARVAVSTDRLSDGADAAGSSA